MAFEPNNQNIKNALQSDSKEDNDLKRIDASIIPIQKDSTELRKNYTFTLQPSVRKKIDKLARDNNFNSASKFLSELIKKL